MRNISFFLTQDQIRARTKTVTRRTGWVHVKPGEVLQPIEKGQGLKAGQSVVKIDGPIRIRSVRAERLSRMIDEPAYGAAEAALEGFPEWSGLQFVEFICRQPGIYQERKLNRIEFEYLDTPKEPAQ